MPMRRKKHIATLAPKHEIGGRRTTKKFGDDDEDSFRIQLYNDPNLASLLKKYKMGIEDSKKDRRAVQPVEDWLMMDLENPYGYRASYGNPMKENLSTADLRKKYPGFKYTKLERKVP